MNKLTIALLLVLLPMAAQAEFDVVTIAHSVSTSIEARKIRAERGYIETSTEKADIVLVVCRSGLNWPLTSSSYTSFADLNTDAESQLNIAGSNFHIYLFSKSASGNLSELSHDKYPAN